MKVARGELWAGRALLVALMLITVLPFISIFVTGLHPSNTLPNGLEWPAHPQWGNFVEAFRVAQMPQLIASSLFLVAAIVPATLVLATMAGFALGVLRIPGANGLLFLFVFGLTIPFSGLIIPIYFLERGIHLYNTRFAIVLPLIALYMPFSVFWMRAHFINMPVEITEAARVDGATPWDLFWQIHIPLAQPPIASLGILTSVWTWNQFLLPLVLVEDPLKRTMAGALGAFQGQWATNVPLLCAGTLLILVPNLIVFVIFQRQIITALVQGAVKG